MKPVRFSALKSMALSPMHYKASESKPDNAPPKNSGMLVGSASHKMILTAGQEIVVFEGKTRRGKVWDAFAAQHVGKLILNKAEYARAKLMADAVRRDPIAQALLMRAPHREQTLRWELAGYDCQGTPDAFGDDILLDVKTTKTAHPDRFAWEARRMGYHGQLDWYDVGLSTGEAQADARAGVVGYSRTRAKYIIAVENSGVPAVTCFELTDELLRDARQMWSAWFERYCVCASSNHWPAYTECLEKLDRPAEEDLGFEVPTGEITADDVESEDDGEDE